MITALAGGVGAARFLTGLVKLVDEKNVTIIVNTGDDIELHGLHISPDIDTIAYTLAGIVDEEKGWGIKDDTFHCLTALGKLGQETWFALGDKDLAMHVFRTNLLNKGCKLSEVTAEATRLLGLNVAILPMTDDRFETRIVTKRGEIHFQEYLVKRQARDAVYDVKFLGADTAEPAVGVIDAIMNAAKVVVCPSNPIVSIGTILALKGVRDALKKTNADKVAVSPIVAGVPIKGPADKLLRGLRLEVSAYAVAELYADFIDTFIIDTADLAQKGEMEKLGIKVRVANTIMRTLEDKVHLAKIVLGS